MRANPNSDINKNLAAITRQAELLNDKFKQLADTADRLNSLIGVPGNNKAKGREADSIDASLKTAREIENLDFIRLEHANGMWNDFQQMLQATGLMKGQFGEIIQIINSVIGGISGGFSFVDSLIGFIGSFIPGGNLIGGAMGAGMPPASHRPNIQPVNVNISGNLTRLGEYSITVNGSEYMGKRGGRNI